MKSISLTDKYGNYNPHIFAPELEYNIATLDDMLKTQRRTTWQITIADGNLLEGI